MKKQKDRPTATICIRKISEMSEKERIALGTWLHEKAMDILLMGPTNEYADLFVARYWQK